MRLRGMYIGVLLAALAPAQVSAQSSLGVRSMTLGIEQTGTDDRQRKISGSLDVAITRHHGTQFDLGVVGFDDDLVGHVAGHLYLRPNQWQKYGLVAQYEDLDDHDVRNFLVGAEGIFTLTPNLTLASGAGLGRVEPSGMDYLFVSLRADYALGDNLSLHAGATLADIDETGFADQPYTVALGVDYAVPTSNITLTAGLRHSDVDDLDDARHTDAFVGLSIAFGGTPGARRPVRERNFTRPAPLDPLWRTQMLR